MLPVTVVLLIVHLVRVLCSRLLPSTSWRCFGVHPTMGPASTAGDKLAALKARYDGLARVT